MVKHIGLSSWRSAPVVQRVRMVRWALPVLIVLVVFVYQLLFATFVHDTVGHDEHTIVEIAFYGLLGPVVAWATLNQITVWLEEKEDAERAVRAQERYLASITNASSDAILSLDTDGVIRSWNRGATLLFNYSAQEMIGQPLSNLYAPDARQGQTNGRRPSEEIPASVLRQYERVCRSRSGRRVIVDIAQTPLQDDSGRLIGASAILRDITQRKARETALEEERARIARDLHDGLAQSLYFLSLKIDYIRKKVAQEPQTAIEELAALKETIQSNIQDVRRTIFALRPVDLKGMGFEPGLRQYVREFAEQNGLNIELKIDDDESQLLPELEPVFFRLIQEGLNNISKHAAARSVSIHLAVDTGRVARLDMSDDGVGFDPQTPAGSGRTQMGLRQMRERVAALDGQFEIESAPGQGTTLHVTLPS